MMDIKEEKIGLIEWIDQVNDVETIYKIKRYIQQLSENEENVQLSPEEKEVLSMGLEDFKQGNIFSDEEVRKPYAKYFK